MSEQISSHKASARRILLVVDCYYPSEKSAAGLARDLAEELAKRGNLVTVLVPSNTIDSATDLREEGGVTTLWYKVGKIKDAHHALRAINEMSLSLLAWLRCRHYLKQNKHDLIIFYSPSIFFGPLVSRLKKMWQARTYLVLRDIFPDWAVDTGVLKKGPVYRVFKRFEAIQYRVADSIGVETEGSKRYFSGTEHEKKIEVLRNWTAIKPLPTAAHNFRSQLGLEGKTVFFYGGNIGIAQDMDNILRLALRMHGRPEAHFLLVGSGSQVEHLKKRITNENIGNVTIHPAVDQEAYLCMLQEFDVGLISLDKRLKSCNYPGKLLGYLRCGIPVLASINPGNDLAALLETSGVGFASINGDDELFHRNALRLCEAQLREQMGLQARELLKQTFAVETIAAQILKAAPATEA